MKLFGSTGRTAVHIAKDVRELLTWAGIPSAMPAELPDLAQELRAHEGWQDPAHLRVDLRRILKKFRME